MQGYFHESQIKLSCLQAALEGVFLMISPVTQNGCSVAGTRCAASRLPWPLPVSRTHHSAVLEPPALSFVDECWF